MKVLFKNLIFFFTTIILLNSCSKDDAVTFDLETPSNISAEDYSVYQTVIQGFVIDKIGLIQRTTLICSIEIRLQDYIASLSEDNPGFEPEILSNLITANQNYLVLNNNFINYSKYVQLIPQAQLNYIFPTYDYYNSPNWSRFYDAFTNVLGFDTFSNIAYNSDHTKAIFESTYTSILLCSKRLHYLEKENQVWVVKKSIDTTY